MYIECCWFCSRKANQKKEVGKRWKSFHGAWPFIQARDQIEHDSLHPSSWKGSWELRRRLQSLEATWEEALNVNDASSSSSLQFLKFLIKELFYSSYLKKGSKFQSPTINLSDKGDTLNWCHKSNICIKANPMITDFEVRNSIFCARKSDELR